MEIPNAWCCWLLISDIYACTMTNGHISEQPQMIKPWTYYICMSGKSFLHALEKVFLCVLPHERADDTKFWEKEIHFFPSTTKLERSKFAFTAPCMPLKAPSRNRVARATQKFLLTPKSVWNTILPQKRLHIKNPCAIFLGCQWGPKFEEEE